MKLPHKASAYGMLIELGSKGSGHWVARCNPCAGRGYLVKAQGIYRSGAYTRDCGTCGGTGSILITDEQRAYLESKADRTL